MIIGIRQLVVLAPPSRHFLVPLTPIDETGKMRKNSQDEMLDGETMSGVIHV